MHVDSTPVGDVIETSAIGEAFHKSRSSDDPLYMYVPDSPKINCGLDYTKRLLILWFLEGQSSQTLAMQKGQVG